MDAEELLRQAYNQLKEDQRTFKGWKRSEFPGGPIPQESYDLGRAREIAILHVETALLWLNRPKILATKPPDC